MELRLKKSIKIFFIVLILLAAVAATWRYFSLKRSKNTGLPETSSSKLNFVSFVEELSGINQPKIYLVMLQNAMELRPTGGFIGSFAKIKVDQGHLIEKKIYDTAIFDNTLQNAPLAPYLIEKYLNAPYWGVRDANWSYQLPQTSETILELYRTSSVVDREEKIDGLIFVTTGVLPFILKETGPIAVPGIAGEFNDQNCLEKLEFEVERGYVDRGVNRESRKDALRDLSSAITAHVSELSKLEQLALIKDARHLLTSKDVQFYFTDSNMQEYVKANNWAGVIPVTQKQDYLSLVDANLGALKTNRCLGYHFQYLVDFSEPVKPQASLTATFKHTCPEADFMTADYHGYLQLFTGQNSSLISTEGFDTERIEELMEGRADAVVDALLDKKIFANLAYVRLGQERTYSFHYALDPSLSAKDYQLYFQKQAGMNSPQLTVILKDQKGEHTLFDGKAEKDLIIK